METKNYVLSKETLKGAITYMPISAKSDIAKQIAKLCLKDMKYAEQNKEGQKFLAMPCLKAEDMRLKNILLLNTLLGYYLNIQLSKDDDPDARYDYYAGGHLLNQIERFKSDNEVRNIAFDLLSDYREFEKTVNTVIYNEKQNNNDPIARFTAAIQIIATPGNIELLVKELKEKSAEYEKIMKSVKVLNSAAKNKGKADKAVTK